MLVNSLLWLIRLLAPCMTRTQVLERYIGSGKCSTYMYRFLLERRPGCTKGIYNAFNLKHIISYYFLPLIFFFKDSYLIFTDPKKRFWICEYFKVCETLRSKIPRSPIPRRILQPIRGIEIFDNLCKIRAWKLEKLSHTRTLGNFGSSEELRRFGINNS